MDVDILVVETVVAEMFTEALQQDPLKQKDWVALVDGNMMTYERCLEDDSCLKRTTPIL